MLKKIAICDVCKQEEFIQWKGNGWTEYLREEWRYVTINRLEGYGVINFALACSDACEVTLLTLRIQHIKEVSHDAIHGQC